MMAIPFLITGWFMLQGARALHRQAFLWLALFASVTRPGEVAEMRRRALRIGEDFSVAYALHYPNEEGGAPPLPPSLAGGEERINIKVRESTYHAVYELENRNAPSDVPADWAEGPSFLSHDGETATPTHTPEASCKPLPPFFFFFPSRAPSVNDEQQKNTPSFESESSGCMTHVSMNLLSDS